MTVKASQVFNSLFEMRKVVGDAATQSANKRAGAMRSQMHPSIPFHHSIPLIQKGPSYLVVVAVSTALSLSQ